MYLRYPPSDEHLDNNVSMRRSAANMRFSVCIGEVANGANASTTSLTLMFKVQYERDNDDHRDKCTRERMRRALRGERSRKTHLRFARGCSAGDNIRNN